MTLPVAEENPGPLLLCPGCGFDLRGTSSERCGECGLAIDREALSVSGIPWAHRRRIGRVRAYLATAWQIAIDRRALRHEAAKPQDVADGRSFRRVTGSLLALNLVAAWVATLYIAGGPARFALQVRVPDFTTGSAPESRLMDLALPWFAGMTLPGLLPVCLFMLGIWLAGAQRFIFRVNAAPLAHRLRAVALSYYTTAPLLLLLPATACWIVVGVLAKADRIFHGRPVPQMAIALMIAAVVLFLVGWLGAVYRIAQWLARARHCELAGAMPGVAELIGLWLLGVVVTLGLIPACIGFLWIAVDSLR